MQLRKDVIWDVNVRKDLSEPVSKFFPPKIGKSAFPSETGATVIRVLFLFNLCRHFAIVIGTRQQTPICKVVCSVMRLVVTAKNGLDLFETVHGDKWRVGTKHHHR